MDRRHTSLSDICIAMLDTFEILTTSGIVLWSKSYANVSANIINSLITDVFIEDRGVLGASSDDSASIKPTYKKDHYTLKWTTARDLGLIFVVCMRRAIFTLQKELQLTLSVITGRLPVSI